MLFVFIYEYWSATWFTYQVMFVAFNTSTMGVSHVEQELLTVPEHLSSLPVFSGFRVTRSLDFCVVFCRSLFILFSFGHCVVCPLIYRLWLPLWYLQTLLAYYASQLAQPYICTYCAEVGAERDRDTLQTHRIVLPVCAECMRMGKTVRKRKSIK